MSIPKKNEEQLDLHRFHLLPSLYLEGFRINMNFSILLGNTFITSFGFVWTRFFIDSKRGFCKKFWQQYIIWGIAFGLITYFWMFRKKTI